MGEEMGENIVRNKSYAFAVRVVRLHKHLTARNKEYVLSRQILRSGTSVGANVEEDIGAQSKREFLAKISIAYNEARETIYWLRILKDTGYITLSEFDSLHTDIDEITRLLAKIKLTTKDNLKLTSTSRSASHQL